MARFEQPFFQMCSTVDENDITYNAFYFEQPKDLHEYCIGRSACEAKLLNLLNSLRQASFSLKIDQSIILLSIQSIDALIKSSKYQKQNQK